MFDFVLQHLFLFLPYGATGLNEEESSPPVRRSGNGNSPISKMLDFSFPPRPLLLLQPLVVPYFENICDHSVTIKPPEGISACSPFLATLVYRHRSPISTGAGALSCSKNVEFGTRIIYCTKSSCTCAKRLLGVGFCGCQTSMLLSHHI